MGKPTDGQITLRRRVICPHCWESFAPEDILWVSQHPDLLGDERLGPEAQQRFLPTRFDLQCRALDARGMACHELACPFCHLPVPRAFLESEAFFLSVLGSPTCGKTYFLASLTWRLRTFLPTRFALSFTDADPILNDRLHRYESQQFLNPNPDALVLLEKTETSGDLYHSVRYGELTTYYLKPFLFLVQPTEGHVNASRAALASRILCIYDNAGESFLPGADTAMTPVTRHLARSGAIYFLFDPTQDVRFRRACAGKSQDPQMVPRTWLLPRESFIRQETILNEATQRIRRYTGMAQTARHDKPLFIIVTKYDAWQALLPELPNPWAQMPNSNLYAIRWDLIQKVSQQLRGLLMELSPEIVGLAESFASQVVYLPISATGCAPEVDPEKQTQGFRPRNLRPIWVEVPLVYLMSRWMKGLVYYCQSKPSSSGSAGGIGAPATRSAGSSTHPN
ncbi:MAG: hypothetical protein NZ602_05530 [Thermoguttaceae bacterium]|nr:hypothetical protein [Thermoguttaceae bacterium]MDW8038843.1 hypothetical protein [Thermoguttaceae bacterium]